MTIWRGALFVAVIVALLGISPIAAASPPPDSVTAPVRIVPGTVGYTPTVRITVGNSAPLTVLLDSGSSGLVINRPDLLPSVIANDLTDLHSAINQTYTSGTVNGELYNGTMTLLGERDVPLNSWTTPMLVGECTPAGPSCGWPRSGIQGVLGIANGAQSWTATSGPANSGVFAPPFTTSGLPLGGGVSFHFDSQSLTGTVTIGTPATVTNGTTLQAPSKGLAYANGLGVYWHFVAGCWVISTITSCDAFTTFDSGAEHGFISTYDFIPLFGAAPENLLAGTKIRFSSSAGNAAFAELTVRDPLYALKYNPGQRNNPLASNSGSGFLLDRDVAINYATGTVTISGEPATLPNTGGPSEALFAGSGAALVLGCLMLTLGRLRRQRRTPG